MFKVLKERQHDAVHLTLYRKENYARGFNIGVKQPGGEM